MPFGSRSSPLVYVTWASASLDDVRLSKGSSASDAFETVPVTSLITRSIEDVAAARELAPSVWMPPRDGLMLSVGALRVPSGCVPPLLSTTNGW